MKNIIKRSDFDFEYNGSNFDEKNIIKNGHQQLSGKELLSKINNCTIFGDYPMGYKFVTDIYENGTSEGVNNVGSCDFGEWMIDYENNTLHLKWKNGWLDTTTRAYDINGNIEFYDIDTGKWRTTFRTFEKWNEE